MWCASSHAQSHAQSHTQPHAQPHAQSRAQPHAQSHGAPTAVVILQPGILGFEHLPVLGPYWGDVPERLRRLGYRVVARAPAPVDSPHRRGAALAADVDTILKGEAPGTRVVIIAHSQGGVDVRAALDEVPGFADQVGAVATVASPHHGSPMADVGEVLPTILVSGVLTAIHQGFEGLQGANTHAVDVDAALRTLSTKGGQHFMAAHPTSPVPFFSVAGVTGHDVDGACTGGRWLPPTIEDVVAPTALWNLWAQRALVGTHSTDGVVPTASMRFGDFLGCVPADHGDWMGWVSHPLEEELVWSPTPFLLALTAALVDVDRYGGGAIDGHLPALARLARSASTPAMLAEGRQAHRPPLPRPADGASPVAITPVRL